MKHAPSTIAPVLVTRMGLVRGETIFKLMYRDAVEDDCACDTETDCACDSPAVSERLVSEGLYRSCDVAYLEDIAPGYILALAPDSPIGPVVMNEAARAEWECYRQPRALENTLDKWLANAGLLQPAEKVKTVAPASKRTLTAWLHITDACNLDCPYCYVRHSKRTMSLEVGLRAVREVVTAARQGGFSGVKLKYAGGEASLHFDRVRALHEEAQRLAVENGLALKAVLLSNGVALSAANADWLAKSGTRLMVSLDGVDGVHDALRYTKDGRGTFARIQRNVDELLLPRGIFPTISVTITGQNADGAASAVHWALERDLPISLNFYRTPPGKLGTMDMAFEDAQLIAGMQAAYRVFEEKLPQKPFLQGLLDRFHPQAHERTCGVGERYWVIGPDGEHSACHMLLDPALREHPAQALRNLPAEQKTSCSSCVFRSYCAGGCPLEAFRYSGRWDAPSPNCAIYRALIPAALRLEGLRLLRQNRIL